MIESTNNPATEPTQVPVALSQDRGIVRAAAILAAGNVTSRVLGLLREIVKSNLFGATDILGAYTVAALVPMTLFNLISGGEMVSSSLVPVFSDFAAKEKRRELWGLVSSFLSLATAVLVVLVLLVEIFAPQVAWLAGARNFENPNLVPLTINLMRLATPAVLFLSLASILTGVLYALERFTLPAFTSTIFNGTIVVVALLRPEHIDSLVWGLLAGSLLQIAIQLPALRDGSFRVQFNWRHPAVRRIVTLYAPIVAGLLINQVAIWISYNLAITTGDNAVTYMAYATTLYQFPLGLVVTALSLATLPTLSQLATGYRTAAEAWALEASDRLKLYKQTLAGGLRLVITLILPAAAGLFALAGPIIALLLEHGLFTPNDTAITALVLRFYVFGLPFAAIDQMLVFASYARKDTWRPALVGVVSITIYTIAAIGLLEQLGLLSLMVADAVKHFVHMSLMLWLLQRHLGGLDGHGIVAALLKSVPAAALTGLAAYLVALAMGAYADTSDVLGKLLVVLAGGIGGLLVYLATVIAFDIKDAKSLWATALRHKR
ncbi:MAG: murein biosynthesis integral membrane protein MurJ [Candidatus Promineifilaceae bacterium]|nr:murein biosynthesis integral membrane protein MurJ [Candidatus Promineifilaceae bacterium]